MREHERSINPEIQNQQYDAIIALGKNWKLPIQKDIHLSIESKLTALAAGHMYLEGKANRIIFSTGNTAGINPETGKAYPNEADEMKKFLRIFFKKDIIPDEAIITENNSFDTAGNAEEALKLFGGRVPGKVALLTVGYHLPRAGKIFNNYGIANHGFKSEDIVENSRHAYYARYYKSHAKKYLFRKKRPSIKPAITRMNIHAKELVARTLAYTIDPKGTGVTRTITSKSRHR